MFHTSNSRKRKHRDKDCKSSESNDNKDKKHRRPRTLGELVKESARRAKKEDRKEGEDNDSDTDENGSMDDAPNSGIYDDPQATNPSSDVPRLHQGDLENLEEDIVMTLESDFDPESMVVRKMPTTVRSISAEMYYEQSEDGPMTTLTDAGIENVDTFEEKVVSFLRHARSNHAIVSHPAEQSLHNRCKCNHSDSESGEESGAEEGEINENDPVAAQALEMEWRRNHPAALHPDVLFNEPGYSNDGPVCRCSLRSRVEGIRHNKFLGEKFIPLCDPDSNNSNRLYHYVLRTNNLVNLPCTKLSQIRHDRAVYEFSGFSVFFHRPLPRVFPKMPISRFNMEIEFEFVEEPMLQNFTVRELEVFHEYFFVHVLNFFDFSRSPTEAEEGGCPLFHLMPRFVGLVEGTYKLLPMGVVLKHYAAAFKPFLSEMDAANLQKCCESEWNRFVKFEKHHLLIRPDKRPTAIRADSFVRAPNKLFPDIIHFGTRNTLSNGVNLELQRVLRQLNKMRKLYGVKRNPTPDEKRETDELQRKVDELKAKNALTKNLTVQISCEGFFRSGFFADIVNHALVVILACFHARYHCSLEQLELRLGYTFRNRSLLELSLTHTSFRNNYGTVVDHARNVVANCGFKRKTAPDLRKDKRKKGLNKLNEVITASQDELPRINHNERLEYLGDAVIELIVTYHLFYMLPQLQEGALATYRSALVQNRNLAALGKIIGLNHWMLFTHGPDLCHDADFRHAVANAFEAIIAAIHLDGHIDEADRIFGETMWGHDKTLFDAWMNLNEHELKCEGSDRHMIKEVPFLMKLTEFENMIGVKFEHIRVLAKAFTRRNIPYNELTRGHNQRLEWLGDTVLQMIVSDYLYRTYPGHNEGAMSLLRTSIVGNKTQAVICDDLAMAAYVMPNATQRSEVSLKMKDKADLVEAVIGALYVDRGWEWCLRFVQVCFLPRLKHVISSYQWNDSKSQLQQACLSLRSSNTAKVEIPIYRVIGKIGATNSRTYKVAVYFREKKLAVGTAATVHEAEMNAAKNALIECREQFPDIDTFTNTGKPHNRALRQSTKSFNAAVPQRTVAQIPSLLSQPPPNMAMANLQSLLLSAVGVSSNSQFQQMAPHTLRPPLFNPFCAPPPAPTLPSSSSVSTTHSAPYNTTYQLPPPPFLPPPPIPLNKLHTTAPVLYQNKM